jgi:glycosyltransferase involved in cell wall biosynthesis
MKRGRRPREDLGVARDFVPAAVTVVDLDEPLADADFGRAPSGQLYGSVLALVRLHDDPVATVEIPLVEGKLSAAELAAAIVDRAAEEVRTHARDHGCAPADPGAKNLRDGMPSSECPVREIDRSTPPFVSVVVPTVHGHERIGRCLRRLCAMAYPRFEVIVVDNAPDDPRTREAVAEAAGSDERIRYVAEPLPGSSLARNGGIPVAAGEIVAFTDDDIEVDRHWLDWLVEHFVTDPEVGVVTGLVMPVGLDTPGQRWFEESTGFGKGLRVLRFDMGPNSPEDRLLFPYWGAAFGSGGSMAFRKSVLIGIDGFDPALGTGSPALAGCDIEAFSHAILRGSRLVYEPRSVCWHNHRATEAAVQRQTFTYAVGFTAIMTKWLLRDARLWILAISQGLGLLFGRSNKRGVPTELTRLSNQVRMHRDLLTFVRQFGGFAAGPLLYLRSVLWVRRLGLRSVLRHNLEAVRKSDADG